MASSLITICIANVSTVVKQSRTCLSKEIMSNQWSSHYSSCTMPRRIFNGRFVNDTTLLMSHQCFLLTVIDNSITDYDKFLS